MEAKEMTRDEFHRFVLGALLHDIGKFKQRARFDEDRGKTHSIIGYEWLSSEYGEGMIAAAARNHHAHEPETWQSNLSLLIYEADNLSASERREFDPSVDIDKTWHHEVLLSSDFSRIRLEKSSEASGHEPEPRYWPLRSLGGWIVPEARDDQGSAAAYRGLWEDFCEDFLTLKKHNRHYDLEVILHLLERYTSFIPSITLQIVGATERESFRKHPDVSLFDHSRVAAAAAACLYRYHRSLYGERMDREILKEEITGTGSQTGQEPFLLVGGDLSGVQQFIYTISSRGALKSLKGRSFFLELLTEHLVDVLLEELGLTRCNVLFTGGGHFYMLSPNTEEARKAIDSIGKTTNEYLWKAFNGNLAYCMAYVPMGKPSFRDASKEWAMMGQKLDEMKRRKWVDLLEELLGEPHMPHLHCLTARCEVCASEDEPLCSVKDVLMCPSCIEQFQFGETLQKAAREARGSSAECVAVAVWEKDPPKDGGPALRIGAGGRTRYYRPFLLAHSRNHPEGSTIVYRLNDWDARRYTKEGERPLMAGVYHAGEFEDLEALAERGYGWNRIAVLRMDVDRLGQIFSTGFPGNDRTFSRMASLSRHLSIFFKYHLNGILDLKRQDGYEKIQRTRFAQDMRDSERLLSVVYSGGDDLFLIGHWLDVLEAAFDIRSAFRDFTANPSITLSGGVALGPSHHPVYRFAEDAGRAEHKAKVAGRNAMTLLGHTFAWQRAEEVRKMVKEEILPLLEPGKVSFDVPKNSVSRGFFHRVLALVRPLLKTETIRSPSEAHWILPKVAYLVGRIGPSQDYLKGGGARKGAWMGLKDRLMSQPKLEHLQEIDAATVWALMMMRKGEK
jgi:CRISPR-associated protein Csm1